MKQYSFKNFKYQLTGSVLTGRKCVEVSFLCNEQPAVRFIFIKEQPGINYINEAKKIINKEIKSGQLVKSVKKFSKVGGGHKPLLITLMCFFMATTLGLAGLFVYNYFKGSNSGVPSLPTGTVVDVTTKAGDPTGKGYTVNLGKDTKATVGSKYTAKLSINNPPKNGEYEVMLPDTLKSVTSYKTKLKSTQYTYDLGSDKQTADLTIPGEFVYGDIKIELELKTYVPPTPTDKVTFEAEAIEHCVLVYSNKETQETYELKNKGDHFDLTNAGTVMFKIKLDPDYNLTENDLSIKCNEEKYTDYKLDDGSLILNNVELGNVYSITAIAKKEVAVPTLVIQSGSLDHCDLYKGTTSSGEKLVEETDYPYEEGTKTITLYCEVSEGYEVSISDFILVPPGSCDKEFTDNVYTITSGKDATLPVGYYYLTVEPQPIASTVTFNVFVDSSVESQCKVSYDGTTLSSRNPVIIEADVGSVVPFEIELLNDNTTVEYVRGYLESESYESNPTNYEDLYPFQPKQWYLRAEDYFADYHVVIKPNISPTGRPVITKVDMSQSKLENCRVVSQNDIRIFEDSTTDIYPVSYHSFYLSYENTSVTPTITITTEPAGVYIKLMDQKGLLPPGSDFTYYFTIMIINIPEGLTLTINIA